MRLYVSTRPQCKANLRRGGSAGARRFVARGREREGGGGLLAAPAEPGEEQEGEGNDADKDDAGVLLCFLLVEALQLQLYVLIDVVDRQGGDVVAAMVLGLQEADKGFVLCLKVSFHLVDVGKEIELSDFVLNGVAHPYCLVVVAVEGVARQSDVSLIHAEVFIRILLLDGLYLIPAIVEGPAVVMAEGYHRLQ